LRYIEAHPEIRDVLLSGGDPLLLSDKKIEHLALAAAGDQARGVHPHRLAHPGFPPAARHPELCEIFKKYGPIWMSIHVNHPRRRRPS